MTHNRLMHNNHGVALILVISILAVLASIGAAFLITARLETMRMAQFREGIRAGLLAEAGLSHAKALLHDDKTAGGIDTTNDVWRTAFAGTDVDNDGDGTADARWITLVDPSGTAYGRYAVTVTDEASRVNINSAGRHNHNALNVTEGYSTFEVGLADVCGALGVPTPDLLANDIITCRYGTDGVPGTNGDDNNNEIVLDHDGLDNTANGFVDEPQEGINEPAEFVSWQPYGDDRPFFSIAELNTLVTVAPHVATLQPYVSAYAFDRNTDITNALRLDVNATTALDLVNVFASAGLSNAGQLAVNVVDYRDRDHESTTLAYNGTMYAGVEGVRINEVMVCLRRSYDATTLINAGGPGGDWTLASDYYQNAHPTDDEFGRGVWRFDGLTPGRYYLRLYGNDSGSIIGDVKVGSVVQTSMVSGDTFIEPVTIHADGLLDIIIYNKELPRGATFTTQFKKFELLQSPDGEYLELVNTTPQSIDVSGWTVEGLRSASLIGTIPSGTTIASFDTLVLAVDKDDTLATVPLSIRGNGLSFHSLWAGTPVVLDHVVQLVFSDTVSRDDDVLLDVGSGHDTNIVLKTGEGKVVDTVEYGAQYVPYVALERGDPAFTGDSDTDGIFDEWAVSLGFPMTSDMLGTPSALNNNLSTSGHIVGGMNTEVFVKNGLLANVGELGRISTGDEWSTISVADMQAMCDHLTTVDQRLPAEGHLASGGWQEESRPSPYATWCATTTAGEEGVWRYTKDDRIRDGVYQLTFYGAYAEAVSISLKKQDGSWTTPTPPLSPNLDGSIRYGIIDIGGSGADALPSRSVEIKIKNETTGACHFDYLVLSPLSYVEGRININTASKPVLEALPGVTEEIADRIIAGRPLGMTHGIGDILGGTILSASDTEKKELFRYISNLITVKSDVYEVLVTGQAFQNGVKSAEKKLRVIVER